MAKTENSTYETRPVINAKPCPYCGGTKALTEKIANGYYGRHLCCNSGTGRHNSHEEAAEALNRRWTPQV